MQTITIMRGLPASGKSTEAKKMIDGTLENASAELHYKRINRDDLRAMLDNSKWSKMNEKLIVQAQLTLAIAALKEGFNIIIDDTNLTDKHILRWEELLKTEEFKDKNIEIIIKDFRNVPVEECIRRDQKRPNYVGEKVIRRMYNQFIKPKPPIVKYNPSLPDAVLCDLDGTLALFGNKSPYERDFENDTLNRPIADILRSAHQTGLGAKIIFVSGRKSKFRGQTIQFLEKHELDFVYELLLMPRGDDDNRKDVVIKQELYNEHIKDKYNVRYVLDDRDQVVELWRSLGLTCLQVAYGDF